MKKLMLLLPFIFLIGILFVNATIDCNITNPSTNSIINTGTQLNITYNASTSGNTANVTVALFAKSIAQSQNTSFYALIFNQSNISNRLHVNITFPSTNPVLGDASDYSFFATCYENATAAGATADQVTNSSIISSVQLDRTSPSVATGITFTNPVGASGTITASITRGNTNRCFLRFGGPSVSRTAMTLSGSTCTFTVTSNNPPNSDYSTFVETDDNSNSTLSAVQYITIRGTKSDGGGLFGGTLVTTGDSSSSGQSAIGGSSSNPFLPNQGFKFDEKTGAVIIIALLAYLYFKKK